MFRFTFGGEEKQNEAATACRYPTLAISLLQKINKIVRACNRPSRM
jgi:hypothetical protein